MDPRDDPELPPHFEFLSAEGQSKVLSDMDAAELSDSLTSEDFKKDFADHDRLLQDDDDQAGSDTGADDDRTEEEPMEEVETSPVFPAKSAGGGKGSFRFALILVTLYPGKEIHYGRFIPVDAIIFRTWSDSFADVRSVDELISPLILREGIDDQILDRATCYAPPSSFEPSAGYLRYLRYLQTQPPWLSRCPWVRIHLDSRRILKQVSHVAIPLVLDIKRKRGRPTKSTTPSSTSSHPARKTERPDSSSNEPPKPFAAATSSTGTGPSGSAAPGSSAPPASNHPAPPTHPAPPAHPVSKIPVPGAVASSQAQDGSSAADKAAAAAAAAAAATAAQQAEVKTKLYIYLMLSPDKDHEPIPAPLFDVFESAYRLQLEDMVRGRLASMRLAAKMD